MENSNDKRRYSINAEALAVSNPLQDDYSSGRSVVSSGSLFER